MVSSICLYNNKIFIANYEDFERCLFVYSFKQNNKSENDKFGQSFSIKLSVKCTYIKEIALKVITNFITGLQCIFVLIFDYAGLRDAFLYSDTSKKRLAHVSLPEVLLTQKVPSSNLFIAHGPAFLFFSCDKFHFYSLPFNSCNYVKTQHDFSACKKLKILQFECFDFVRHHMFFFIYLSVNNADFQTIHIIAFISKPNKTDLKYKQLPLTFFFPQQYQSILKAVDVTKFIPSYKTESRRLKGISCEQSIAVICTNNDCLLFFNGVLKFCCKLTLPLFEVMCINVEFSNASSQTMNFVLTLKNETTYLITGNENRCEVVKYWTDIKATTFGDMLLNGSEQLLLLKTTDIDTWQQNCILIDIVSKIPVDLLSHNAMRNDCLKSTLAGLQKKIQVGNTTIADMEHGISQKAAATIDSLIRLKEFKTDEECVASSNTFRKSLVDLILHKDENKSAKHTFPPSEYSVKLLDEKQRYLEDHWILCLHFINESVRCIYNPSMKVFLRDKRVQSTQKLFAPRSDEPGSLMGKDCLQINPKGKFTILLKLSLLTFQEDTFSFILTWLDGSVSEFENELLISKGEKKLRQHQLCFRRRISVDDIFNGEIERGISSFEDLLFTKSSQHRIVLQISSLHSDITHIKSTLLKSDANLLILEDSSNCIVFNNEKSHLFGVNLVINNLNENTATIEAFTRNEKESLLLVYFLHQHLPDDILILPSTHSADEVSQMKKDVICAIKNEVDLLVSSLNIHNITEELRKNYSKLISSHNVGTITIQKEIYRRIRRALVKKELVTDSVLRNFENV